MQLLHLREVQTSPRDLVFRHAPLRALIVWLAFFSLDAYMLFRAFATKWVPGYIFGPFLLLFLLLTLGYVTARFHPSNWLVRLNDSGFYLQYRSYLNYGLSPDDPSVVFLSFSEIASARLIKERVNTPDSSRRGTTQTQFLRYVELELSGDTAALAAALASERGESAPEMKRWYGSSSTLYLDYPVTLDSPPFLRIHWDVSPRAKKFLDALRPFTQIAAPISIKQDFTRLLSLAPEAQKQQLRVLAQRGDVITAAYLARHLYRCSLAEATQLISSLQRSPQP